MYTYQRVYLLGVSFIYVVKVLDMKFIMTYQAFYFKEQYFLK